MKILIIGGTGLISTPITRMLAEQGDAEVTVYNRGKREPSLPLGVRQVLGDRTDFAAFETQMQATEKYDCVIDMVCYRPEEAESVVRAFRGRVGQYLFCSTVDVYAKPQGSLPLHDEELHNPALWDYAQNKAKCEAILQVAYQQGDFPLTILRPAHTYHDGGTLVHTLGGRTTYLDRLRRGKPIIVHGDGSSLWVSCHAEDVARAFVKAIGNPQTLGKSYHLPGEEWLPWNRYHQIVAEAIGGPPPKFIHIPTDLLARIAPKRANISLVNFQYHNIFDTTAARCDLDFRYTIPFAEGAKRVATYLTTHNRIENSDEDPLEDRILSAWEELCDTMAQKVVE